MTQPFTNKMMNKLLKKRISKKHKRQNNKTKQKPKKTHILKITRINPQTYINSLLYYLIKTTDYDRLQILQGVMEKNEENFENNESQSEIVIIKLKSNILERYIILIDFTIMSETKSKHIYTTSLNKAILQALNEKKKYISFECDVQKKHKFNTEIQKISNIETNLAYNLHEIYQQIFYPFDTYSQRRVKESLFCGVIPNEVPLDMTFTS